MLRHVFQDSLINRKFKQTAFILNIYTGNIKNVLLYTLLFYIAYVINASLLINVLIKSGNKKVLFLNNSVCIWYCY